MPPKRLSLLPRACNTLQAARDASWRRYSPLRLSLCPAIPLPEGKSRPSFVRDRGIVLIRAEKGHAHTSRCRTLPELAVSSLSSSGRKKQALVPIFFIVFYDNFCAGLPWVLRPNAFSPPSLFPLTRPPPHRAFVPFFICFM